MPSAVSGEAANEEVHQLRRFHAFIRTLRNDLTKSQSQKERVLSDIRAFEELKDNVAMLQQEEMRELDTLVSLGCGVFGKARVRDTSRIFVDVGLGFHAECTLSEALGVADARLAHLRRLADEKTHQMAALKARLTLMEEGVQGLEGQVAGGWHGAETVRGWVEGGWRWVVESSWGEAEGSQGEGGRTAAAQDTER